MQKAKCLQLHAGAQLRVDCYTASCFQLHGFVRLRFQRSDRSNDPHVDSGENPYRKQAAGSHLDAIFGTLGRPRVPKMASKWLLRPPSLLVRNVSPVWATATFGMCGVFSGIDFAPILGAFRKHNDFKITSI